MQGLSGAKYRSKLVWIWCPRKRKTRLGEWPGWYNRLVSVLTEVALCEGQDCQSPAIHQRDTCRPGWMWYHVTMFVQLYGDWLWSWISVMFVDRTLGTIVIWTGIHEPIIKRRVTARTARKHNCCLCHAAGQNRQILPVYGVGTHLRNVASREVMSRTRLCIPGANVSMPSQPLIFVETSISTTSRNAIVVTHIDSTRL